MNISDNLKLAIKNKLESKDHFFKYILTPSIEDLESAQSIYEAREDGISIYSFGDTSDKVVITPAHLGYKYSYTAKDGVWGDSDYDSDLEEEEVNKKMFYLAKEIINLGYKVWMVDDNIDGRGYLNAVVLDDIKDKPETFEDTMECSRMNFLFTRYFFVLFVFTSNFKKDFEKYIDGSGSNLKKEKKEDIMSSVTYFDPKKFPYYYNYFCLIKLIYI
jgi:hypothetical protein